MPTVTEQMEAVGPRGVLALFDHNAMRHAWPALTQLVRVAAVVRAECSNFTGEFETNCYTGLVDNERPSYFEPCLPCALDALSAALPPVPGEETTHGHQ